MTGAERTRCGKEETPAVRPEGAAACFASSGDRRRCGSQGGDLKGSPLPHFQPRTHLWSSLRETTLAKKKKLAPKTKRDTEQLNNSDEKVGKELTSVELPLVPTGLSTRQVRVERRRCRRPSGSLCWVGASSGQTHSQHRCVHTRGSHVTVCACIAWGSRESRNSFLVSSFQKSGTEHSGGITLRTGQTDT